MKENKVPCGNCIYMTTGNRLSMMCSRYGGAVPQDCDYGVNAYPETDPFEEWD